MKRDRQILSLHVQVVVPRLSASRIVVDSSHIEGALKPFDIDSLKNLDLVITTYHVCYISLSITAAVSAAR